MSRSDLASVLWVFVSMGSLNALILSRLHARIRAMEQPLTRKARAGLERQLAASKAAEADYLARIEHRREDKDSRQMAAERALDAQAATIEALRGPE